MASQSVTLITVRGTLTVPKVLLCYLVRSKNRIQAGQFAAKHLTMPYIGVLYHPSSGQIYHAHGQYPSCSDDDITQIYAAWPFITIGILIFICHCFTSIHPFCFHLSWVPMDKTHPQLIPMKLWLSSMDPMTRADMWHCSLWRKCGKCGRRERQ